MFSKISTKLYLFILLSYIFLHLGYWYFDKYIPFGTAGETTQTVAVPGKEVKVYIPAWRDLSKRCDVLFSRYMYDSGGTYYDIMATRFMSYEGLKELHRITPNSVKFAFNVPAGAAPGQATVITQLSYMCNPLQYIWPMDYAVKITINIEKSA